MTEINRADIADEYLNSVKPHIKDTLGALEQDPENEHYLEVLGRLGLQEEEMLRQLAGHTDPLPNATK